MLTYTTEASFLLPHRRTVVQNGADEIILMKSLAWIVALFIMAVGVTGIIAPDRLFSLGQFVATPAGLLVVSVVRIAIGVVLIMSAPASRMPRTLQVVGAIALLAGLVTPLFGVERTKAVLAWEAAQGTMWVRIGAALALGIGGALAFALMPGKTPRQMATE